MNKMVLWVAAFGLALTACGNPADEQKAATEFAQARGLEYDVSRIDEAIARYREIATTYPGTDAGAEAGQRAIGLQNIRNEVEGVVTSEAETVAQDCRRLLSVVPNYPPLMRRLGQVNYNTTRFWSRSAPKLEGVMGVDRVVQMWAAQDTLFSKYPFGATPEDRDLGDMLCRQAVDIGKMLEKVRRYDDALRIVERGITYGHGLDALMNARVYASFYNYRTGNAQAAIRLANEAADYEHLPKNLAARAHHVKGLAYFAQFESSGSAEDLDNCIAALNRAVDIDATMQEAREMLRELRTHRDQLVNQAS